MKPSIPFLPSLKTLPASVVPLCAVALFLSASSAIAADFVWTGTVDEFWAEDGNWNLTGFPEAGDTASISGAEVDLGGPQTADRLTLSSGASLFNSGSDGLTVGEGIAGNVTPIVSLSGNGTTISAPITFGGPANPEDNNFNYFGVSGTSADTITLSGPINVGNVAAAPRLVLQAGTNAANVVISGNISGAIAAATNLQFHAGHGSVTLSGNNTFTTTDNRVVIGNAGANDGTATYYLSHGNALGSTTTELHIGAGVVGTVAQNRAAQALITEPGITISGTIIRAFQGARSVLGGSNTSGTVTWDFGTLTLIRNSNTDGVSVLPMQLTAAAGGTVIFTGEINDAAGGRSAPVEKIGEGTFILSRALGVSFQGPSMTVKAGTLLVTNTTNSGTSGASVIVESGAVLGGTGRIAPTGDDTVTVESGGILLGGMGDAAAGSLRINGDLNFDSGSTIRLVLGSDYENSSLQRAGGTWTFDTNQQFDFTLLSGAELGTYENIITGLASDPGVGSWLVTTPGYGGSFFTYDTGNIHLELIPEPSASLLLLLGIAILLYRRRGMFTRPIS